MTDPNCLFCKIIRKEIPSYAVFEDDHALAFLDITPRAPGHTLVIPKGHAANVLDLPDMEVGPLFSAVRAVTGKLAQTLSPDGITIGINQGKASGQEVEHLHIHLMPRWHNDGGGALQSVVHNPGTVDVAEMQKKITG